MTLSEHVIGGILTFDFRKALTIGQRLNRNTFSSSGYVDCGKIFDGYAAHYLRQQLFQEKSPVSLIWTGLMHPPSDAYEQDDLRTTNEAGESYAVSPFFTCIQGFWDNLSEGKTCYILQSPYTPGDNYLKSHSVLLYSIRNEVDRAVIVVDTSPRFCSWQGVFSDFYDLHVRRYLYIKRLPSRVRTFCLEFPQGTDR